MRRLLLSLPLLGGLVLAACTTETSFPAGEGSAISVSTAAVAGQTVSVMTRNLYVGTDVDMVIGALMSPDPNDDLPAILAALQVLQETDFPTRVHALADEIERHRPNVVGLQEVYQIDIDLTAFGVPAVIHQDFITTLVNELQARGLDYQVAAQLAETDANPLPGISIKDHDAILVDHSVATVTGVLPGGLYSNNIGPVAPGISLVRGWVGVTANIGGSDYTLVNTHLESGELGQIALLRAAQAQELVASIPATYPVILTGDFNDVPGSAMYQIVSGGGFTDLWPAMHPEAPGLTCCQDSDLSNQRSDLRERIDFVFLRDLEVRKLQGRAYLVGAVPEAKLDGPAFRIWPSDHAGLVGELIRLP